MNRLNLINDLVKKKKYKKYLEIGVLGGWVFFRVDCKNKIAVDPEFKFNRNGRIGESLKKLSNLTARYFELKSHDFFELHAPKVFKKSPLDISLIDGMHEYKYALNDVLNCLKYLSDDGVIIMHDCNPVSAEAACSFDEWKQRGFTGLWNGDVWKVIAYLRKYRNDLNVFVADCDHGLGIITKKKGIIGQDTNENISKVEALTYQDLEMNRAEMINLKPVSSLSSIY